MSAKTVIVLAALGVAGFMVYQKTRAGTMARPVTQAPTNQPSMNVNSDMWAKILGDGAWMNLLGTSNGSGGQAFTMTDGYGRYTTSDGVPIGSGDYLSDFVSANTGLPSLVDEYYGRALYDSTDDLVTGNWTTNGGVSPLDELRAGSAPMDFYGSGTAPSWMLR